jgi:hypothetical protein
MKSTRSSQGKKLTENVLSSMDRVSGSGVPPSTGSVYALKMPVALLVKRMRFSSALKEAPIMEVVAMNCSMV